MADLELSGPTPVIYYDAEDEVFDGLGWNALLANEGIVCRFATPDEALAFILDELATHPIGTPAWVVDPVENRAWGPFRSSAVAENWMGTDKYLSGTCHVTETDPSSLPLPTVYSPTEYNR